MRLDRSPLKEAMDYRPGEPPRSVPSALLPVGVYQQPLLGVGVHRHTFRKADQLPLWAACAFCCAASAMLSVCVQCGSGRDVLGMSPGLLVYAAEGLPAV